MFRVSCLGIWWCHNIWISKNLKFDYLKNKKLLKWNKKHFSLFLKFFFCSMLNNFLDKKTPNIPLIINDSVASDFTTKANLFNNFFASQCSVVVNSSTLPNFSYKTQKNKWFWNKGRRYTSYNQKFESKQST